MTNARPGGGPSVRRMLVGAQLRRLRIQKGLTQEEAGAAIRASEWKIHRLENGQVSFKERDVIDLVQLYGVTDSDEVAALVSMAREASAPSWWQQFDSDVLPSWFRAYVDLESSASLIRAYEGQVVPGLLQTDDYTRALIDGDWPPQPVDAVERRVELHMARQQILMREDPPKLWVVVDEAALRRPIGGPKVMRTQLERLIEATGMPNVTLQVLPLRAGWHPGAVGAFALLRFDNTELPDVVYVELLTSALYLDKREDVDHYSYVMQNLCLRSVPAKKSVGILRAMLREA